MRDDVKIKPKVILDELILKLINKFYSSNLTSEFLNNECFSHPVLDSHLCVIQVPVDGGKKCEYCNNIVGRRCPVTCDISHFCLAVFAYRLGIGGDDLEKAIHENIKKLSYSKLFSKIMNIAGPDAHEDGMAQDFNKVEMSKSKSDVVNNNKDNKEVGEKDSRNNKNNIISESEILDDELDLIGITEAAKLYDCSYYNMYSHVKRGNLNKITRDKKHFVLRSDVLKMKSEKKGKN